MSKSQVGTGEDRPPQTTKFPRAIIHRQILDIAAAEPDASMETIAQKINGASTSLVERVLEEYGDPIEASHDSSVVMADSTDVPRQEFPTPSKPPNMGSIESENSDTEPALTEKQIELLRLIRQHPTATQSELAQLLDVSPATISNWANSIPGFNWATRHEISKTMIDEDTVASNKRMEPATKSTVNEQVNKLSTKLESVEDRLEHIQAANQSEIVDPELVAKVVHACIDSELITQEEELQIIQWLLTDSRRE